MTIPPRPRRSLRAIAVLLLLALVAAGCGGAKAGRPSAAAKHGLTANGLTAQARESGLSTAGKPVRGGKLVYGIEGESEGGFCLPEAQLAISGMLVVRAVYDTLTVPNAKGEFVPYLAKSITPNATDTVWTIVLRSGISFHDGTPLTAQVVKNNLDAYRGQYPGRHSLLFSFVLQNVKSVDVVDGLTVRVTTKVPWAALPAHLYSSARMGIMAQAQLDDPVSCDRKLIGTGPFVFKSWAPGTKLLAVRNPHYWQIAPDGKPYPYAASIEFRPITDSQVMVNDLQSGTVNIVHSANSSYIGNHYLPLRNQGKINLLVSSEQAEVSFVQLNNTAPPFDDARMRLAFAKAVDRTALNQFQNAGFATVVDGPISKGSMGFVAKPGFPAYDPAGARKLIAAYRASGKDPNFVMVSGPDPDTLRLVQYFQQTFAKVGLKVRISMRDQSTAISDAIGKKYQASLFRNYPGGDADQLYVWFYGGTTDASGKRSPNPVNFAGFDDPAVNQALDQGRSEPNAAKREAIYEGMDRRLSSQAFDFWMWSVPWAVATNPKVHGIFGPPLPGADPSKPGPATTTDPNREPNQGLATGHSLLGLWVAP